VDPKTQPLIGAVPDRSRLYSVDEERRLAENLTVLTFEIHERRTRNGQANEELLCDFHRRLFDGVRDHAGVIRKRGFGTETLTFGPNRSPRREEVPDQLYEVFVQLQRGLLSFDQNPNHPQYEHSPERSAVTPTAVPSTADTSRQSLIRKASSRTPPP
jgi:fido (protein-threonine AMPylation protein)